MVGRGDAQVVLTRGGRRVTQPPELWVSGEDGTWSQTSLLGEAASTGLGLVGGRDMVTDDPAG